MNFAIKIENLVVKDHTIEQLQSLVKICQKQCDLFNSTE